MHPTNRLVGPLLTDLYQLTMAYAYWKSGRHNDDSVFDLFFRKNPFGGEFTIFAGLEEALRYIESFRFTDEDIDFLREGIITRKADLQATFEEGLKAGYVREGKDGYEHYCIGEEGMPGWKHTSEPSEDLHVKPLLPECEPEFFGWLKSLDCREITIHALREGTITFPRIPLLRIEGPLGIAQLLETALLNLVNYSSLVATKAARLRLAAGKEKVLLEFGLRRAQGPDGALSASRYTYLGGFDSTSNVLAGKLMGIPVKGTHAHSFVSSFSRLDELRNLTIMGKDGAVHEFVTDVLSLREELGFANSNEGELAAFISYAQAFPNAFLALVDTYDTLKSGVPNFICLAIALMRLGYSPVGFRIDSGDLAYLSRKAREMLAQAGQRYSMDLSSFSIVASNDINEATLHSLNTQGHSIDIFGIGTHLVTCFEQPALGGVYKLVMIKGHPRIKISDDVHKVTIPGRKEAFRVIGQEGYPLLDLLVESGSKEPRVGERILCRHPYDETKRVHITPTEVITLHRCVWDRGRRTLCPEPLSVTRSFVQDQLSSMRSDHLRAINPTPYKVSVTDELYQFIHSLWLQEAPIAELH
jgi:nicotinate phosphoribosyltransferase